MATDAETRKAYAAGARSVEQQRDMRAMERVASALERIATHMEKGELANQIHNAIKDALFEEWRRTH